MNKSTFFQFSVVGLIIFQIAQIMEQIMNQFTLWIPLVTSKIHNHISFFPIIQINQNVFMLICLLVIVVIFILGALIFLDLKWVKTVMLFVAIYAILVCIISLLLTILFKKYFPGTISSCGLMISGILILLTRSSPRPQEYPEIEE